MLVAYWVRLRRWDVGLLVEGREMGCWSVIG